MFRSDEVVMADQPAPGLIDWEDPVAMERRIFILMCAFNVLAVLVSAPFLPWRFTTGLALGGFLAWLNYRWLKSSIAAAFGVVTGGAKPNVGMARFALRYFAIAAALMLAYWSNAFSMVATLAAMGSFALAAMCEGFIQTLLIVVRKEGN
jgi:hypothetical protein